MSNVAAVAPPNGGIGETGYALAKARTTSSSATVQISNRKLPSSYLDLTPLPENVLLDAMPSISSSFESNGDTGTTATQVKSTKQWDEEEDKIRKRLQGQGRLPSSHEMKRSHSITGRTGLPGSRPTQRPSTAPVGASRKYGAEPQNLRSARYLAMQWRSRATQWSSTSSLGGKSNNRSVGMNDSSLSLSSSQPPDLAKVEDDHDYSSDASSDSEISHKSTASLDESTRSHISDAHSVVEVWKDRAISYSASSDSGLLQTPTQPVDTTSQESAVTVKARGGRRLDLEEEEGAAEHENQYAPNDPFAGLSFAVRPATVPAKLSVKNLLKTNRRPTTPLQRITSGQEYQSSSQRQLEQFRSNSAVIIEANGMEEEGHAAGGDMSHTNLSESSVAFSSTLSSIDGESSTMHNISLDGDESRGMSLPDPNATARSPSNHSSTSGESFITANESFGSRSSDDQTEEDDVYQNNYSNRSSKPVISTFVSPAEHANEMRRFVTQTPRFTKAEMQHFASTPHSREPVISTFIKTSKDDRHVDGYGDGDGSTKYFTSNSNEVTEEAPKKRFVIPSIEERQESARRARAEKAANMKAKLEAAKAAKSEVAEAPKKRFVIPSIEERQESARRARAEKAANMKAKLEAAKAAKSEVAEAPKKRFVIPSIEERQESARRARAEKAASMQNTGVSTDSVQAKLEAAKAARSALEKKQKQVRKNSLNSSNSVKGHARKSLARKGSNASSIRSKDGSVKSKSKSITSAFSSTSNSTPKQAPKWTTHDVTFTFGILTASTDAPPTGPYDDDDHPSFKNKLVTRSKLLHEVMNRFALITRRIKRLGHGKYMMFAPGCTPSLVRVDKDSEYLQFLLRQFHCTMR